MQGFDDRVGAFDVAIGVTSAIASGLAYTFVRRLKAEDHELVIIFYFPLITIPVVFPFMIHHWVTPSFSDFLILCVIGAFTQAAQVFLTRGYQAQKAADIGLVNYLGVIYATFFGWFLFSEAIPWMGYVGMWVILMCVSFGQLAGRGIPRRLMEKVRAKKRGSS